MMHNDWMPWGWGGMWFGPLLWIALLSAMVWLAVTRFSRDNPAAGAQQTGRTAMRILDERFAKGEIDQTEYEARRKVLSL